MAKKTPSPKTPDAPEVHEEVDAKGKSEQQQERCDETPLQQAERERGEYLANWQRARADYQNLKRRTFDDVRGAVGRERSALLEELLTILDYLDMALVAPVEHLEATNLKTGVQMTRDQLWALLERHRVTPIEAAGGAFDPALHQAVATVETDEIEPGHIVEVVRQGFMIGDDVLRYAQVKVGAALGSAAKAAAESEQNSEEEGAGGDGA